MYYKIYYVKAHCKLILYIVIKFCLYYSLLPCIVLYDHLYLKSSTFFENDIINLVEIFMELPTNYLKLPVLCFQYSAARSGLHFHEVTTWEGLEMLAWFIFRSQSYPSITKVTKKPKFMRCYVKDLLQRGVVVEDT